MKQMIINDDYIIAVRVPMTEEETNSSRVDPNVCQAKTYVKLRGYTETDCLKCKHRVGIDTISR